MPNHCENYLQISFEDDGFDVKTVLDAIAGETAFDFNRLIPYPEQYKRLDDAAAEYEEKHGHTGRPKDGFNSGGYEWCNENWGTKWNAYSVEIIEQDQYSVILKFQTAWSPPTPVIERLAAMFPLWDFTHEYYERVGGYCGSARYSEGKLQHSGYSEEYYGFRGG